MKRSEMLVHISEVLKDHLDDWQIEYISEEILCKIEDAGMAPPKITILPDSYNRAEGSYGFEVYEWEEEIDDSEKK